MFARRCGLPNWSILKALGPEHPSLAASINNLGQLYHVQGKDLNNLAGLYYVQGNYAEAEPLWKRSLACERVATRSQRPCTDAPLQDESGPTVHRRSAAAASHRPRV